MTPILILMVPIALLGAMLCVRKWRWVIPAVLIWALFEGAVRKWGFPQAQGVIYIAKDFVLIAAYLGFIMEMRKAKPAQYVDPIMLGMIIISSIFLFLLLFNPEAPSVLLSFVGLKNHLTYIPLAFIIPAIITSERTLYGFIRLMIFITILLSAIGLYQFTQPGDAWINQTLSFDNQTVDARSYFGQGTGEFRYGFVRTSSTFSYIGGFVTYLVLAIPSMFALIFSDRLSTADRRWAYLATLIAIGAAMTTGSRTPIFIFAAGLPLLFAASTVRGLMSPTAFFRIIVVSFLLAAMFLLLFSSQAEALLFRAGNADSNVGRILSPFIETYGAFQVSPLFGTGLGTNSNAASTIMQSPYPYWLDGQFFELESARIMQETGFFGFLFAYAIRIYAVVLALRYARRHTDPFFIGLCFAAAFFFVVHLVLFIVNNPLAGIYYWTLLGVVFATGKLADARKQSATNSAPSAPPLNSNVAVA